MQAIIILPLPQRYTVLVDSSLNKIISTPAETITTGTVLNITGTAQNGVATIFYEVQNFYGYDSTLQTDYIETVTCTHAGVVGSPSILVRSVGLASKAFLYEAESYFLAVYSSIYQPTYFLLNGSGNVISKIAYSNGGGYLTTGLPSAVVANDEVHIGYLFKDLIESVNKTTGVANTAGIYSQTGINLATFTFENPNITSEIGQNLYIAGGIVWDYDGYLPVENNFFLWPDQSEVTPLASGGQMQPQQYFYQFLYRWVDNQGNISRSAPSVPIEINLSPLVSQTTGLAVPIVFTGTFTTGSRVVTVTSGNVGSLFFGLKIVDTTTGGNIGANITISSINVSANTITLNNFPSGNSASAPGDSLTATIIPVSFTASFGVSSSFLLSTTSLTGSLHIGQILVDSTTQANLIGGTYVTSIDSSGKIIGISNPTANAGPVTSDTIETVSVCSATLNVPTLRLTYKTANPVLVEAYRWSEAQQEYFKIGDLENDPTRDYVTFTDGNADSVILGNELIYTTGGVIEDIAPPPTDSLFLFDSRLWLIDSEDRNLLWYSKQVIENTPVEMSDLFTIYVAPTISAQGSTGDMKCLSAMDDKLIIFKENAIYYINGSGPDNTGANSTYSQPTFITSTVGCSNQQSIVFMQDGLMFQSDKGIWLLNRGLGTLYIGAPVEAFTLNAKSSISCERS